MEYEHRRVSKERQKDLFGLFQSAFGSAPTPQALASKHDTSFAGVRDMGLVAYAPDGTPAGYYGVFPVKLRIAGKSFLAAQSGDTMVHKSHGGKGLFVTLAKQTYELARSDNIGGVFGFPSPSSYPGFVKRLEWQHHENIQRYRFYAPMAPLSEFLWRYGPTQRLILKWQNLLLRAFKPAAMFSGTLMQSNHDCVERSQGYWSYKMSQPQVRAISVAGVETVIKLEGSLGLGDVNSSDPKQIRSVLRRLKVFCFFAGIGRINSYLSKGGPLETALNKMAMPTEGLPIGYVDFSKKFTQRNVRFCYMDMDTF